MCSDLVQMILGTSLNHTFSSFLFFFLYTISPDVDFHARTEGSENTQFMFRSLSVSLLTMPHVKGSNERQTGGGYVCVCSRVYVCVSARIGGGMHAFPETFEECDCDKKEEV